MSTLEMTAANHDESVQDGITLIDFWADWCVPCHRFAPVYDKVSEANPDVTFAKVDTEAEQQLAAQYGITSIPTLVAYRDGIPVYGQPGAMRQSDLEDLLTRVRELDMADVKKAYEESLQEQGHQH